MCVWGGGGGGEDMGSKYFELNLQVGIKLFQWATQLKGLCEIVTVPLSPTADRFLVSLLYAVLLTNVGSNGYIAISCSASLDVMVSNSNWINGSFNVELSHKANQFLVSLVIFFLLLHLVFVFCICTTGRLSICSGRG